MKTTTKTKRSDNGVSESLNKEPRSYTDMTRLTGEKIPNIALFLIFIERFGGTFKTNIAEEIIENE